MEGFPASSARDHVQGGQRDEAPLEGEGGEQDPLGGGPDTEMELTTTVLVQLCPQ